MILALKQATPSALSMPAIQQLRMHAYLLSDKQVKYKVYIYVVYTVHV